MNSILNQPLSKPITTTRTDPGKRIQLQQLDSTLGPHCTTIVTGVNRSAIIGLEYPVLQFYSPFTYVAKTSLVVFSIKLDTLMREIDSLSLR
jgi:hypothetical protein